MTTEHRVTLRMEPVPERFAAVYHRRGMTVPTARTPHDEAAAWPYEPRIAHQLYARAHGYFWLPCVLCARPHGGHEISDRIPDPTRQPDGGVLICPACTAERNGGRP